VHGSNNPLGIDRKGPQDSIPFHPYYTIKDTFGLGVFMLFYMAFVFFAPNFFGEPENYIRADSMQTPLEIVPEWYLLPFYAILRSIPDKLMGVIAMFGSILILFVLPWLDTSKVRSARYRPIYKQLSWVFIADCILLGWVGGNKPEGMVLILGQLGTAYYFAHFLVIMPLVGWLEKPRPLPESISEPVIKGEAT
ncbi:MAG: cytochrome b, partial [Alphaproteobacteria bacterium]